MIKREERSDSERERVRAGLRESNLLDSDAYDSSPYHLVTAVAARSVSPRY